MDKRNDDLIEGNGDTGEEISTGMPDLKPGQMPKKLEDILYGGTFDNIFTQQQMASAIKVLVEAGYDIRDLLMRADFPKKRTESHRYILASMRHRAKCREFGDTQGEDELMDVLAGFTSSEGKRIEKFVEAVTGQVKQTNRLSFAEKIRKAAGIQE